MTNEEIAKRQTELLDLIARQLMVIKHLIQSVQDLESQKTHE